MQETQVQSLGQEDPLQEEMATHSSILAWKIPQTDDPGGLQSMGSQRVRQGCAHVLYIEKMSKMDLNPTLGLFQWLSR